MYRGPNGRVADEILYRHDEPRLEIVEAGRFGIRMGDLLDKAALTEWIGYAHERLRRLLGLSIDEPGADSEKKVRKFVRERKIDYPIALDGAAAPVWEKFRVKAVPAAFLVDRRGNIVAQWTGAAPTGAELEALLPGVLAAGDGS